MNPPWLKEDDDGVVLTLHVVPGAKKTEIVGVHGDALKVRLAAPPVEGKANEMLLAFLAQKLETQRAKIRLVSGTTARGKRVRIEDLTKATVLSRLLS